MQLFEIISYWLAVLSYATAFGVFCIAFFFAKDKFSSFAIIAVYFGLSMHTLFQILRWIYTGHPPFVSLFESASATAWFAILFYLILQIQGKGFDLAGLGVSGGSFLLMGWASTPSYAGEPLSAGLDSVWLFIHASFATASVALFLVAAGISFMWLKRNRQSTAGDKINPSTPELLDEMVFRYIMMGFLFHTIMLASGAVWANNAWGRYWAWDPIETWSLITWIVYALYLHIHFTFKRLRGKFTAWYAIIAVLIAAFSLWGVGYVYQTIHSYG
ncbi:MAG: cytochrome c biogenesis protein CcsA [Candidatus Marinimicrobia bacterium]|nr:cytochrome c biogenesis protein CcsA [Candidatus Neomarinimicrobiota bacterium]